MTNNNDVLYSQTLAKAFYGIVLGHNYSHKLARHLKWSQPGALKLIKKLVTAKLIKPLKMEGRLQKYSPDWKNLSLIWADFNKKFLLKEIEMDKNTLAIEIGDDVKTFTKEEYKEKRITDLHQKFDKLRRDSDFSQLAQIYFEIIANAGYAYTLLDAFIFFQYDILPEWERQNKNLKKEFELIELLDVRHGSNFAYNVARKLEEKRKGTSGSLPKI